MVRADGVDYGPLPCDIFLEFPYKHRHHETGIVGFEINNYKIPDFGPGTILEVSDAETGLVFYRRMDPNKHLEKRVFRLETQMAPHSELDRSLKPFFQFYADRVEQHGSETVRQMLEITNQRSTYVSGRVLLKNFQQYLPQETVKITSLRDPFYEFAIRLTTTSHYKNKSFPFLSSRDQSILRPAMDHFADLNLMDDRELTESIKSAPKDILALFASPFTKQLVAASPTDPVDRDSLSRAMDVLSQFAVFDPDEIDDSFAQTIADHLGIDRSHLQFRPVQASLKELADRLRNIPVLEHVLESDLILYFFVQKAKQRARLD
ncbi:hypothetical protein J0X15_16455 [Roseibium sp. CAU 1637]|uniref:Uncharacterized protein n=1 Tax=Roseibium limicola TaxID=2816037 RepID=A0A939J6G0_9HYPH|nr:hypothetical protein [Roseibium limicola]MBO0346820.1 hypothetical protein [Roseibium limicola]